MALLLVEDPARTWLLDLGPRDVLVIGRGPAADLPVSAPRASRRHARIAPDGRGGHCLEDLGSTNGTLLDGAPALAHATPIRDGGVIEVGECRIVYRTLDPDPS